MKLDIKWIIIVLVEVVIASIIGFEIYKIYKLKDGKITFKNQTQYTSPIKKDALVFPSINVLKYYYEYEPGVTVSDKPDWLPYTAMYTINNESLNNQNDYSIEKQSNTFRIVAMGDSFTFGLYSDTKDSYPSKLESALNATCGKYSKFEVLNLGMGGYDIQYAVERFSIHGQKYNPNLVVWLINSHNLTQIREYLQPIQDSLEKNTSESVKQDHYTKSDYAFMVNQATQKMNDVYGKNNILNQQKQFFQRFSSLYQGPLAIIMFSSSQNSVKDVVREYASTRDRTYFYDGLPDIQNEYVLSDGHPSVKGYDLISQNIYKYLVSQKILPCQ